MRAQTLTVAMTLAQCRVARASAISSPDSTSPASRGQPRLLRDGARRGRVVAGDHHHADAGRAALGHGGGHLRAHRVGQAEQPDEFEVEVVFVRRPVLARERTPRHRQHAQARAASSSTTPATWALCASSRWHKSITASGAPFGGHGLGAIARRRPHVRHRAQRRAERIGLHQAPVAVQVFGVGEEALPS
jgi:hypothetical protein